MSLLARIRKFIPSFRDDIEGGGGGWWNYDYHGSPSSRFSGSYKRTKTRV